MNKEKLDALLANGSITQEEYDALLATVQTEENPQEPDLSTTITINEAELERMIQSSVDKITSKLGKEKADLQKQLDKLKREKLSDEERRQADLEEREQAATERERALLEKENRLYAIKAIKAVGLDDGSDTALEIVDFVLSDETDEIDRKTKALSTLVKKLAKGEVDRTFKENGRTPGSGTKSKTGTTNPYAKESFNLTEQMRLEYSDPELAAQMKAAAGGNG